MVEKKVVIDSVEILRDGHIQVREATLYLDDGVEVAKSYHRHVLSPGDSTVEEGARVKAVSAAVWTKETLDAFAATETEKLAALPSN